jgi:hypothetical protein
MLNGSDATPTAGSCLVACFSEDVDEEARAVDDGVHHAEHLHDAHHAINRRKFAPERGMLVADSLVTGDDEETVDTIVADVADAPLTVAPT